MEKDDNNLLLERYLAGDMSPEEVEAFEERCLHDPVLQKELEVEEQFRDSVRRDAGEGVSAHEYLSRLESKRGFKFNTVAIAASALIGISVIATAIYSGLLREKTYANVMEVTLVSLRGAETDPVIRIVQPDEPTLYRFTLKIGPRGYDTYTLSLLEGEKELRRISAARPSESNVLTVESNSDELGIPRGASYRDYSILVYPDDGSSTAHIMRFDFRITRD
ncbi:MAG: hypothetical protein MJA83_16780 [Gammaproteobacteria bacterium]|nr:hypothetical protein [Gammaproteobacteria bacterium]